MENTKTTTKKLYVLHINNYFDGCDDNRIEIFDTLERANEELKKANEGLAARLESLEDSLAKAGVLRIPTQEVGVDKPSVVASENPSGNLSELLRVMNGH